MDMFGDPEIFAEFEKPREASDALLLETLKHRTSDVGDVSGSTADEENEGSKNEAAHPKFILGVSDESSGGSSDEDSEIEMALCDQGESKPEVKNSDEGQKKHAEDLGDNREINHELKHLQREIDRLKKDSILCKCRSGPDDRKLLVRQKKMIICTFKDYISSDFALHLFWVVVLS